MTARAMLAESPVASLAWFAGLFDDAAIFPPGNTPMAEAVTRHLAWRASRQAPYVGPFVCSSTRWDELVGCLPEAAAITVSLTVPGGPDNVAAALEKVTATPRVDLASVEVPLVGRRSVSDAVFVLDDLLPSHVTGYLELPPTALDSAAYRVLADSRHHLKLRTGGTSADAFPNEADLARAIRCATRVRLPFKLTAGLHHAVRHDDPATGFEHHGFVNVVLATAAALTGRPTSSIASILAIRNSAAVADAVRRLSAETAHAVRRQFESFGTCSIAEPLDDLTALGLLEACHG